MGITHSAGTEHNLYWNLGNILGNQFEDIIYNIVLEECKASLYKSVKVEQTSRSNDGGKDIIIEFSCKILNLFDIAFYKEEKSKAIIYIECKSTNSHQSLRREKFMPSIEKGSRNEIDYYVLLTNSKILPLDYYDAEKLLECRGTKFVLIDQFLLARFIKNKYYNYFNNVPLYKGQDDFYVQYQVYLNESDEQKYDIYFNFRNYSENARLYTISLLTDVNWITEENSFSFTIDSNCACSRKISLICDIENEYKALIFKIEAGKHESFVNVKGINIKENYMPPFIGKYHNKILSCMQENIADSCSEKIFCLWGEAGIGKTRIINELRHKITGGHFDIFECSLNKDNISAIQEIQDFLIEKKYLSDDAKILCKENLYNTILNCRSLIKTALICIDDFHNSSLKLIEQIKKLYSHSAPVIIILCGRTDYTEGDTSYYSFVQWTFENLKIGQNVWNVKSLRPKETKRLIRVMIQGIPEEALNMIYCLSDNNPLYIVQFIEYLLDEKIAYIVNRNTVGIIDPAKFQSHDYLPNGITDIYSKRIAYLINASKNDRNNYINFLFVLAVFNGQISVSTTERYYDQEGTIIAFLHKRGFITRRNNFYFFYHESLKFYVQNILFNNDQFKKETSEYILALPKQALKDLPSYTIGRLYLWIDNIEKAIDVFNPIINTIKKIRNISNIDIDSSVYEYFDDILQILKNNIEYRDLAQKIINGKIYITLHHFVPTNAAAECDKSILYIKSSSVLKEDKKLLHSLLVQKAHALLNSGMNLEGELVLKELQAKSLVSKDDFDPKSIFDMFDRLCAIYIKYNCYGMACDYSRLELDVANKSEDNALAVIAYRTRSKLFYLNNPSECQDCLSKVDELLKSTPSPRIQLHNNIYRAIVDLTYNITDGYDEIINRVETLTNTASKQNLNRANIQSNMVLAAAYLKRGSFEDLKIAKQKAIKAINYSIRFGIPSYMWQLYNILAVIDTKLGTNNNKIKQSFEMSFDILNKQNLLYIGRNDLSYSNILAISNIGFFLRRYSFQKTFNSRISMLTYCEADTENGTVKDAKKQLTEIKLTELYEKALKKELLFTSSDSTKLLRDDETGYFIALT